MKIKYCLYVIKMDKYISLLTEASNKASYQPSTKKPQNHKHISYFISSMSRRPGACSMSTLKMNGKILKSQENLTTL